MLFLPLDPISRVTGSCSLLVHTDSNTRVLVDCGAYQGLGADELNDTPFLFNPKSIDWLLLTHAHFDHCGRIPALIDQGFRGQILCTRETWELARVVLADSLRIQDRTDLLWTIESANVQHFDTRLFQKPWTLANNLCVVAHRSSHILGAVSYEVSWYCAGERSGIVFSGDIGSNQRSQRDQPLLGHRMVPRDPAKYMVLESTYGGRTRERMTATARRSALKGAVVDGVMRGGPVILPSFSIHRMQELLFDLHVLRWQDPSFLQGVPLLVDTSMGMTACKLMGKYLTRSFVSPGGKSRKVWLGHQVYDDFGLDRHSPDHVAALDARLAAVFSGTPTRHDTEEGLLAELRPMWRKAERYERDDETCAVVLTSSGMCGGGPVVSWLQANLTRPQASVYLSGYCTSSTVGGHLLRIAAQDPNERLLNQLPIPLPGDGTLRSNEVRAKIGRLHGYSGHADQQSLVDHVFGNTLGEDPRVAHEVILNHGDDRARQALCNAIYERCFSLGVDVAVRIPQREDPGLDLNTGLPVSRADVLGAETRDPSVLIAQLRAEVAALKRTG